MKTTVVFVLLQFIVGFGSAIAVIFIFSEYDTYSLNDSILLTFLTASFSWLLASVYQGISFKIKHVLNKFGLAMVASFAGTVLFLVLYLLIEKFLDNFEILILFILLTGAVFGFNLVATIASKDNRSSSD